MHCGKLKLSHRSNEVWWICATIFHVPQKISKMLEPKKTGLLQFVQIVSPGKINRCRLRQCYQRCLTGGFRRQTGVDRMASLCQAWSPGRQMRNFLNVEILMQRSQNTSASIDVPKPLFLPIFSLLASTRSSAPRTSGVDPRIGPVLKTLDPSLCFVTMNEANP